MKGEKKKKKELVLDFDKEKEKLNKFDPRGVQTLFRTLSRNHYNLLKMVDNKASIILTVNSIIISLLMGVLFIIPESDRFVFRMGARILINFSLLSMIFALLAMLPHKYLGRKFKKSGYKGSLYAANFVKLSFDEFKNEFQRIISNGNSVYNEMVEDLYFLGVVIQRKQKMVIFSVVVFLIGLASTFIYLSTSGIPFE